MLFAVILTGNNGRKIVYGPFPTKHDAEHYSAANLAGFKTQVYEMTAPQP